MQSCWTDQKQRVQIALYTLLYCRLQKYVIATGWFSQTAESHKTFYLVLTLFISGSSVCQGLVMPNLKNINTREVNKDRFWFMATLSFKVYTCFSTSSLSAVNIYHRMMKVCISQSPLQWAGQRNNEVTSYLHNVFKSPCFWPMHRTLILYHFSLEENKQIAEC